MLALINEDVAGEFERITGIKAISLPPYSKVADPISKHADTLSCIIDDTIFLYKDYLEDNKELFEQIKDYNVLGVEHNCNKEYPFDVGLNILVIGKKVFCNEPFTSGQVLDFARKNGYDIVSVKQGYAGCSTLVIDEKTAITSDKGVYSSLINQKIDVVFISPDDIKLSGYKSGFIGGSGCFLNNRLYFFGNINKHRDIDKVKALADKKKIELISILPGDVSDFGGVRLLEH